uniref:Glutathione peroxidase n=1 Tax=Tetradesmus obliquus TaxID=3088 RepID=A0A383VFI9_TETOB|eukprot:jgi/Sobl393_1/4416/SZX63690.1
MNASALATSRPAAFLPHKQAVRQARRSSVKVMADFHSLSAKTLDGEAVSFDKYKGKVVLVTNVACFCGLTNSNYKELVQLNKKYADQGLVVMAWPCNSFGAQEPGSPEQIKSFVKDKFGGDDLTFMEKVEVNGPGTHPVWKYLKGACPTCDGEVTWNFKAKFIIDKEGNVVERNGDNPLASEAKLQQLLAA